MADIIDAMDGLTVSTVYLGPALWTARIGRGDVPNNEVPRLADMLDAARWKKTPEEPSK